MHGNNRANRSVGIAVDPLVIAADQNAVEIGFQRGRIDAEGVAFAIDEMRRRAAIADRVFGGHEGEGGNQNFIPGLDASCIEHSVKGGGAVDGGNGMPGAGRFAHH